MFGEFPETSVPDTLPLKSHFLICVGHFQIKSLTFDKSGTYLAVAGTDIRVYLCKQWQELQNFNEHGSVATGVRFGENARFVASCSMDRTLKYYSLA